MLSNICPSTNPLSINLTLDLQLHNSLVWVYIQGQPSQDGCCNFSSAGGIASDISIISLLILTNKECKWNKYMVDVGLWSSLFILVGMCRNICSKSKFIDHRVEVTESENNYYGNFSVFVIFAPLWNYFLLFSWDEKCNYPNLHSNVDTRQIFLKYDSIWKRQNTRKKQVLACFVI